MGKGGGFCTILQNQKKFFVFCLLLLHFIKKKKKMSTDKIDASVLSKGSTCEICKKTEGTRRIVQKDIGIVWICDACNTARLTCEVCKKTQGTKRIFQKDIGIVWICDACNMATLINEHERHKDAIALKTIDQQISVEISCKIATCNMCRQENAGINRLDIGMGWLCKKCNDITNQLVK